MTPFVDYKTAGSRQSTTFEMVLIKAVFSLLLVSSALAVDQFVHVEGQILCAEHTPPVSAMVQLKDADYPGDGDWLAVNMTNVCGNFSISGVHDEYFSIDPRVVFSVYCRVPDKADCIHTVEYNLRKQLIARNITKLETHKMGTKLYSELTLKGSACVTEGSLKMAGNSSLYWPRPVNWNWEAIPSCFGGIEIPSSPLH